MIHSSNKLDITRWGDIKHTRQGTIKVNQDAQTLREDNVSLMQTKSKKIWRHGKLNMNDTKLQNTDMRLKGQKGDAKGN